LCFAESLIWKSTSLWSWWINASQHLYICQIYVCILQNVCSQCLEPANLWPSFFDAIEVLMIFFFCGSKDLMVVINDIVFIRFVKKKFEELYFQSTTPDRVDRVFKIYRTTALDQKLVKKTFKLVDETLRRRNLFEAGLLWIEAFALKRMFIVWRTWSGFEY